MYLPPHFIPPKDAVDRFLAEVRFSDLVTSSAAGLVATSLPLIFDASNGPAGTFRGHVARANRQWADLADNEALVLVRGDDAYISPSYYPSKTEHGQVVPTWNYLAVQAHGRLVIHDDREWTERLVRDLTDRQEAPREQPWSVDDAPRDYIDRQLRAIVGIEVTVDRLEAKWKLSQNRTLADVEGVRQQLAAGNAVERSLSANMPPSTPELPPSS